MTPQPTPNGHLKIRLPLRRSRGEFARLREPHIADDPRYFIHGVFAHSVRTTFTAGVVPGS